MRESVTVVPPYIHGGLVSGPPKVTKICRCSCRLQLVLCSQGWGTCGCGGPACTVKDSWSKEKQGRNTLTYFFPWGCHLKLVPLFGWTQSALMEREWGNLLGHKSRQRERANTNIWRQEWLAWYLCHIFSVEKNVAQQSRNTLLFCNRKS